MQHWRRGFSFWGSLTIGLSLTNLEELSFLTVLAFLKASRRGLAWMIWSSRVP